MFLNVVTFLLTTYFYYNTLVPKLSYDMLTDSKKYENYVKKKYISLAIYFLLILIIQFFINTYSISTNCGGLLSQNMSASAILTLVPWSVIFGAVVLVLTVFPGFKGAFSNVIGYYFVSKKANDLLTDLLVNQKLENTLNENPQGKSKTGASQPQQQQPQQQQPQQQPQQQQQSENLTPTQSGGNKTEQQRLADAADAIVKICGNTSILINQILPSNFAKYWKVLDPLMKPQYRNNSPDGIGIREQLFKLSVDRDTVGEAMWFIYTGILIASVVQMKITTRGCEGNLQAMEQNYQQFQQEEQAELDAKAKLNETEYTITN